MVITFLLDSVLVGAIAFYAIKKLFGNGPLGRILSVLGSIFFAIFYLGFLGWINQQQHISDVIAGIVFFGPISCALLLALLKYAFAGSQQK